MCQVSRRLIYFKLLSFIYDEPRGSSSISNAYHGLLGWMAMLVSAAADGAAGGLLGALIFGSYPFLPPAL